MFWNKKEEKKIIGEYFQWRYPSYSIGRYLEKYTLRENDIKESHNGEYKIHGDWIPKENIIIYDNIYDKQRDKIQKRLKKEI